MNDYTHNNGLLLKILDVIYGISFMLGPLTLPVALFVKDVDNRWISFVACPIFVITLIIRKRSASKKSNNQNGNER